MVVSLHCEHMGRVPLSVQGPGPSHKEPVADVDPEVVAMVTCVEGQRRCMGSGLEEDIGGSWHSGGGEVGVPRPPEF